MDCLSAISLLLFQMVCINITAISSDEKQQLADTLDRLLKFAGWKHIDAMAKHQNAADETATFGGMDLYKFELDLNSEYDVHSGDRIVNVENVDTKYDMIVHLLGCVYTNAALTFLNFLHVILLECKKEKRNSRNNECKKIKRKCAKNEIHLTRKERSLNVNDSVDLEHSKMTFNTAVEQLKYHSSMLNSMSTALRYLIALAPSEKTDNELTLGLKSVAHHIDEIIYIATHINLTIPLERTTCEDDENYKKDLMRFSGKVFRSIDVNKKEPLVMFKTNYCVLPDYEQTVQQLKWNYQADVIIEKMKKFENEVCTCFYTFLGFDSVNEATTLATDNMVQDII